MNFENFVEVLSPYFPEKIVFVGLGNELRGDDAAGLLFLERLKVKPEFCKSNFIKAGTNPENHLQKILDSGAEVVIFIDAARSGAKPGTIGWIDPGKIDSVNISTHAFSIKMVEEFLDKYHPFKFMYLGIEPLTTKLGENVSSEILESIDNFFV